MLKMEKSMVLKETIYQSLINYSLSYTDRYKGSTLDNDLRPPVIVSPMQHF